MSNLQDEFKKEFKQEVGVYGSKDIYSIPLPECCNEWYVSGREMFYVQGIEDKYFEKLNGSYVERPPKGTVVKRRKVDRATRSYKRNPDGSYDYEEIKVSQNCVVVISEKNLSLPYGYKKDGYGYVDFVIRKGKREFLYIVKKENLYKANQTALAISVKNMKNYSGMGYMTWRSGVIYLHIIPYKPNSVYVGSKILKTGVSLNYGAEIKGIVNYWISNNVIPNITLCSVDDGNLVLRPTEVGYADYIPYDVVSLGDREVYGSSEQE